MPTSFLPKLRSAGLLAVALIIPQLLTAAFVPAIDPGGVRWQPGPGAPAAVPADCGVEFWCPFAAGAERFYWDCPARLDLSSAHTIEVELSLPVAHKFKSVSVYLRSGKGWYLWIKSVTGAGRRKLFLQKADAGVEGATAGWNAISAVRVSFQSSGPASSSAVLHALRRGMADALIVKAVSSAPNEVERAVSDKAAGRIAAWMDDMGIPHSLATDGDLAAGPPPAARTIILPYNPKPSEKELDQLEAFASGGGKLIVFYSSNPRLAKIMNLKIGKYRSAEVPGQWSFMQFNRGAPAGTPHRIIQNSGNIFTVFPDADDAEIIAYWLDADGKAGPDPAWLKSSRGFWMTHILLGEDSRNKQKMLLALLGNLDRNAWKSAAQRAVWEFEASGRLPPDAAAAWKGGDYARVLEFVSPGRVDGFASRHTGARRKPDFIGAWNHSGLGLYPGNWDKTCRILAGSGVKAIFPNTMWAGAALYPSKFVRQTAQSEPYGDQMAQCLAAARAAGIEAHAWKVCWQLGRADAGFKESMRKQRRLQMNSQGNATDWLCPSHPANIALELDTIAEAAGKYNLDGVHLDYIRYPDANSCFCSGCRDRFEKWAGAPVASWPADVVSGARSGKFREWRALQITDFVRLARQEMKKARPKAKLSAAVYPKYPDCVQSIGQDWVSWLKENIVDFVCPMDYFPTAEEFRDSLSRQTAAAGDARRIYPGIGATLSKSDIAPDCFLEQINAAAELGAGGCVLFDLNPSLAANFLPLLGAMEP